MKNKKAQLTIIIIIAIVIVGGISTTAIVINKNKRAADEAYFAQADIKPTLDSIKSNSIECVKETSKNALDSIGEQGGFYNKPKHFQELDNIFIPYYYYEGEFLQPPLGQVQLELDSYIKNNLDDCLNKIDYPGYQISLDMPKPKTTINEKDVTFNVNQNINIQKEGHKVSIDLSDHPQTINSELKAIINLAEYITESHKEDPELYCVSCVAEIAEVDNLFVDNIEYDQGEILVIISETHTRSEPYSFEFLNKYTGDERTPDDNIPRPPI